MDQKTFDKFYNFERKARILNWLVAVHDLSHLIKVMEVELA